MMFHVRNKIYSDELLLKYLKEHSYWYKDLNRNASSLDKMIMEMKESYGLRFKDKVDKFKTGVELINAFLNIDD